ncbi:hypothetical protein CTAM01_01473 [Colletotrichum tamarilloi]|uniref:DNA-directed RNA polymerase II subunit RPB1 n=1 Tax=Colletotrichum tamarilloi TaxID=1209934 RepID=A0ABQ9RRE5_9PEZI|nr:uncharacterized protein CTAM01_01473 [Colletotrichum tamarilloi]KAK1510900.1 hypothetical protein CTAM01_01473 [Colletotrichum tamarilloi]
MDARALLQSQGWRGSGHSLHATDDRIGLAKPLLLNRKDNTKGLGTKAHFTSDTWWMNAFDEQLQGLDTSKPGQVTQTVTAGRLNQIEKVSGGKWMLYASFVKGGFLEGTIEGLERMKQEGEVEERVREVTGAVAPQSFSTSIANMTTTTKVNGKRKEGETKEERRARKAAKAARKTAREARRVDRAAKKVLKEERRARRKAKEAKREARKAEKAKKVVSG